MVANNNNDIDEYFRSVAKVFLVIMIALCVLSIMCCCKSYKNSVSTNEEVSEKKHDSIVNSISFDKKWFENYIQTKFDSEESVKIVIYDTNLPVDTNTNRPPVVAEIEKNKKSSSSIVENNNSVEIVSDSVSEISSQEELIEKHEENKEIVKKSIDAWRLYIFVGVILICVVSALWGKHLIQDGVMYILNKIFK